MNVSPYMHIPQIICVPHLIVIMIVCYLKLLYFYLVFCGKVCCGIKEKLNLNLMNLKLNAFFSNKYRPTVTKFFVDFNKLDSI